MKSTRTMWLAAVSATALTSGLAAAQDGAQAGVQTRAIDTITVTAQKREQSLQDVPVSVQAVSAELLENGGVDDIKELVGLVPGLMVTSTTNESVTTARIRGIGTVGDNSGLESSVGVVIDGVIRNRNGVGFNDLGEIERIEVLRGPQGSLFGKNTSAGIIQVVTRAPEYDFSYGGEVTVGNYGEVGASAFVTGPLSDNAAFRLYAARRVRDEGYVDNAYIDGDSAYNRDYWSVRGQLQLDLSDNASIRIIGDYTDRDEDCCSGVSIISGPIAGVIQALGGPDAYVSTGQSNPSARMASYNRGIRQLVQDGGLSIQGDFDFSFGTLTTITAWRDWETNNGMDIEFTGADVFHRDPDGQFANRFETFTQEVRLAGQTDRLDWLVGAFYADEDLTRRDQYIAGAHYEAYLSALVSLGGGAPAPNFTFLSDLTGIVAGAPGPVMAPGTLYPAGTELARDNYYQSAESFAVFTNNTVALTDSLDLTVGARYTMETKDLVADFTTNAPGCAFYENIAGAAAPGTSDPAAVFRANPATAPLAGAVGVACLAWTRSGLDASGYDQSREENELTGTVKLSWRANDDVMIYGSYGRGYKAGGYNLDRSFTDHNGNGFFDPDDAVNQDTSFEGEFVDAWELGFRTEWLNDTLLANATVFYQEFDNFQLNTFLGTTFTVVGVPEVTSQGVEADFVYLPDSLPGTTLQGGFAYTDAVYEEFGSFTTGSADLDKISGQNLSLAPEWAVTGAWTQEWEINDSLNGLFHIDGRWVSDYNTGSDLDPEKVQEDFALFNARIGVGAPDESWSLEVWGRNLTDETYYEVAFDAPLQSGSWNAFLGAPRTYGVTLRARR